MATQSLLSRTIARLLLSLAVGLFACLSQAQETLTMPVWSDIFDSTGTNKDAVGAGGSPGGNGTPDYVDLYGAVDAVFAGDNISDSVGTDMSVSDGTQVLADTVVRNDTVAAVHDLGNGFVMARRGSNNDLLLYGGMERLAPSGGSSYVEFEFNQEVVQAIRVDVALRGERKAGDLLIRLTLDQGVVTGAQAKRWTSAGEFTTVHTVSIIPGVTCSGDPLSFKVCDPWLASGQHNYQSAFDPWTEGWDMTGNPVSVPQPNAIVEFAVNVSAVSGSSPDYSSIIVRTPRDITLSSFRRIGYWAQVNNSN